MQPLSSHNDRSPRVSVITPFLDNDAYLAEAIESVLAQTYDDWEYLLVDDGSKPAATAIAKDYVGRYPGKLRYFEHPGHVNRGTSATRNVGVRNARGEILAFLDSDDLWLPGKLADHVAALDAHPEVGLVAGATVFSWMDASRPDEIWPTGEQQGVVYYPQRTAAVMHPIGRVRSPSFSDVVVRKEVAVRLGGFEEKFAGMHEDTVFLTKVFLSTPVYFCSEISNKVRVNPTSTVQTALRSGTMERSNLAFFEWVEEYLQTLPLVETCVWRALRRALRPYRRPRAHRMVMALKYARARSGWKLKRIMRMPLEHMGRIRRGLMPPSDRPMPRA